MRIFPLPRRRSSSNEEGFSLVELMVVVLIIGIIAAIAIPVYAEQQRTAMKAQVDTDMLNTAQALSQWQQTQDGYLAIPDNTTFQNKIVVKSDTDTTLTLLSRDWGTANTRQFCVQASKNISGTNYVVHYQLTKKTKGLGACPAFVQETEEAYG